MAGGVVRLAVCEMAKSIFIVLNGIPYNTKSDACRAYNISVSAVNRRIKRGMSVEDAIVTPLTKTWGKSSTHNKLKQRHTTPIKCGEEEYDSIIDFARDIGISRTSVYALLKSGETPESIVKRYRNRDKDGKLPAHGKQLVSRGVHYNSIVEFAGHLGVGRAQVEGLLKSGVTPDEIESRCELKKKYGVRRIDKVVVVDGVMYPSKSEACRVLGLYLPVVNSKMRLGLTFEEAVMAIRPCMRYSKDVKSHKRVCNGKYCLLECAICGRIVLLSAEEARHFEHSDKCEEYEWEE